MKFKLLIAFLMLFMFSCGESKEDSTTGNRIDSSSDSQAVYFPSGHVEDGPCLSGGNVSIQMLYPEDLRQTSEAYTTTTESNFGYYDASRVMRATSYQYSMITVTATCHNEVTNSIMENKTFRAIVDLTDKGNVNINPLTTIITDRQLELFQDSGGLYYQDFEGATIQAETELLENVFNIYGVTDRFKDMALNNRNGGPLLAANAILLEGKTVPEQNALMNDISVALRDSSITQVIIDEVLRASQAINMSSVRDNLEGRYLTIGLSMSTPDFWQYIDSDNNGVLNKDEITDSLAMRFLKGDIKIIESVGINEPETMTSSSSQWYSMWATPYKFDTSSDIGYVLMNTEGDMFSIYDNDEFGDGEDPTNDRPGTVLKTVFVESQNIFAGQTLKDATGDSFTNLPVTSIAEIDFTPELGKKYWLVNHCDEIYKPYIGRDGAEFKEYGGRALSTGDGTWIINVQYNKHRIAFTN